MRLWQQKWAETKSCHLKSRRAQNHIAGIESQVDLLVVQVVEKKACFLIYLKLANAAINKAKEIVKLGVSL